jgi:hypothetical protein
MEKSKMVVNHKIKIVYLVGQDVNSALENNVLDFLLQAWCLSMILQNIYTNLQAHPNGKSWVSPPFSCMRQLTFASNNKVVILEAIISKSF